MTRATPSPLPPSLELAGVVHRLEREFKRDWLSCVGLYRAADAGAPGVILKSYRERSLWGLPILWLTRRMAAREVRILRDVQGLEGVPREHGTFGGAGLLHEFLEGHPLKKDEAVRDDFFARLERLVAELHARGVAYVDLSKRDNVLVGEEGGPCLIDFQIAWTWPDPGLLGKLLPGFVGRGILARLQRADRHHVLKHRSRVQPESLSEEQRRALARPSWPIRVHRKLLRPYQKWRRRRQGLSA